MKVSVIIPAYNAAQTLAETLMSLQNQTFTDWEAIIVDDGSKDNTVEIAQSFADGDGRCRVVQQPNGGVSAARNTGIQHARHPWLLFMDSDDWIVPHHLQAMTAALQKDPTLAAVYSGWVNILPNGNYMSSGTAEFKPDKLFDVFGQYCAFCIHACVIRKDLVLEVGGFDPSLRTCEDWDLWQRAVRTGALFGFVPDELAMYRMRPGSASKNGMRMLEDGLKVILRGHSSDPRVKNPAPQYANGRSRENLNSTIFTLVNWTAGLMLGSDADARPLLTLVQEYIDPGMDPGYLAESIFKSALQPTGETEDGWIRLWPKLMDNLILYLNALEAHSRAERLTQRTLHALARIVMEHTTGPWPLTLDRTHGCIVEMTRPIPDVETPPEIERLFVRVMLAGYAIGSLELPVFDGNVSSETLANAIAQQYFWKMLMLYFEQTAYPQLDFVSQNGHVNVLRNGVLLAEKLPVTANSKPHLEETIGWTLLLQEFWQRPSWPKAAFYDETTPDKPTKTRQVEGDFISLDVAHPLPNVALADEQLTVDVMLSGAPVGRIEIAATDTFVSAQQIRAAVALQIGMDLAHVLVREALLGKPLTKHGTLHARLQSAEILRRERQQTTAVTVSSRATSPRQGLPAVGVMEVDKNSAPPSSIDLHDQFETIFTQQRDPWQYTSPYEQIKYAQSLALLPERPFARALEIGCAEGHFTAQLAHRVEQLQAVDIAEHALAHAAERCRGLDNVTFTLLDLRQDALPQGMDLIVCSEIFYYLDDVPALRQTADRLSAALGDEGYLLTAHAHVTKDDPNASGFTWKMPFGAKTISDVLQATPGLTLRKEVQTPLYRVQLYQKRPSRSRGFLRRSQEQPQITRYPYQLTPLPAHVSAYAAWKNGDQYALPPQVTKQLPILMYHRVAPTGAEALSRYRVTPEAFEAQLRYLREAGYYSVSLDQWHEHAELKRPLPGKAIVLTFDDGYLDFYTYAYPLLRKYSFSAIVFLVTDNIGKTNSWDAVYGESVPLMDWEQIEYLSRQGIQFGSHTTTHPHMTGLTPEALIDQAGRSRLAIAERLQIPVNSFAYPYGDTDEVVQHIMGEVGYTFAVTTEVRFALFEDRPLALPRIEVEGKDTLKEFEAKLKV